MATARNLAAGPYLHVLFLSYLILCSFSNSAGQEAEAGSDATGGADAFAVAKQWEEYGKSVAAALSEEKKKSASLTSEVDNLKSRAGDLEASLAEKEKTLNFVKKDLKIDELDGEELKARLHTLVTAASQKEGLEAKVKALTKRAETAEKAAAAAERHRKKLLEAESALSYAKKALLKAEEEAMEKASELQKATASILPPWAKVKLSLLQKKASFHWEEYAKPAAANLQKKASEGASAAKKWAHPHFTSVHAATKKAAGSAAEVLQPVTKFVKQQHETISPVVKKHWESTAKTLAPHWSAMRGHAHKGYKAAADFASPHLEKASKFSEPYVKVVREKSMVAYDAAYTVVGPYVEKVSEVVNPHVARAQGAASDYHEQLQTKVKETLESTAGITDASPNFIWYLASALVLLPVLLGFVVGFPLVRGEKKVVKAKATKTRKPHRRPRRD